MTPKFPRYEYRGPQYPIRVNAKRPFRIYSVVGRAGTIYYTERDQDKSIVGGPYPSVDAAMNHLRKFVRHV